MKSCKIHTTKVHVVIFCQHISPEKAWYVKEPMVKLDRSKITIKLLGETALNVLKASGDLTAIPNLKTVTKAMVEFAGFKSWGAFANATESSCSIKLNEGQVTITPSFRDGRGFSGNAEKIVTCELTAESLGNTLFTVLGL